MAVLFIRKPSETPNIQNIDDIRMVRYAYGNQNGYIKGYGAELSHTTVGSTFLINSGIFVIQGAEVKIDANGWGESVSGVSNKRYITVYGEVNLALETAEIKSTYSPSAYPDLDPSDDLTQQTGGTARVELYRFTATNGLIADIQKRIQPIKYLSEVQSDLENSLSTTKTDLENKIEAVKNIEEGGVVLQSGVPSPALNLVRRQINFVNIKIEWAYGAFQKSILTESILIGRVPTFAIPKSTKYGGLRLEQILQNPPLGIATASRVFSTKIDTNGDITIDITGSGVGNQPNYIYFFRDLSFGYEIE